MRIIETEIQDIENSNKKNKITLVENNEKLLKEYKNNIEKIENNKKLILELTQKINRKNKELEVLEMIFNFISENKLNSVTRDKVLKLSKNLNNINVSKLNSLIEYFKNNKQN